MTLEKTDLSGFSKDTDSKAILNTNAKALKAYKMNRARNQKMDDVIKDVAEIKEMLKEVLNANNK